jgi:mRNA interferase RelE/StbE
VVYRIRLLDEATRDLAHLDKPVARRVTERLNWLAGNWQSVKPEALTGELAGLFKLRAGDYRVIYEVLPGERTLIIHAVGHRSQVYRRR